MDAEISMSEDELRKFVGRYQVVSTPEPNWNEAIVEMIDGKLGLKVGSVRHNLIPISRMDVEIVDGNKSDAAQFKLVGEPGSVVHFLIEGSKVERLMYYEERGDVIRLVIAVPKR